MFKKNQVLFTIVILTLFISSFMCSVKTEDICSYDGPDNSEGNIELTNFVVSGTPQFRVGEQLRVSFTLKNIGNTTFNFTDLGVFTAVRVRFYEKKDFGFSFQNYSLSPNETIDFDDYITIDKNGCWQIWPSYEYWKPVWSPVLKHYTYWKTKGVDFWHYCQLTVCPDYCEDNIRYYNGYIDQQGNCSYHQEPCEYGCDENGIDCSNVSRIKIIEGPNVEISNIYCVPQAIVSWNLNIAGTGTVYYREFGSFDIHNLTSYWGNTTSQNMYISNLKTNTTYYYYVKSCGPDDCVESTWDEFTTPNFLHIEDIQVDEITERTAKISWKTYCYEPGESQSSWNAIDTNYTIYVVLTAYSHFENPPWDIVKNDTYFDNEHQVTLRGMLDDGKNYTFFIKACTDDGICMESSKYTFTTGERPFPQILDMNIEPSHHSVKITWNTFQTVNTTITLYNASQYPDNISWKKEKIDENHDSFHTFDFDGLDEGTIYVFKINHSTSTMSNTTREYYFKTTSCWDNILNGGEYDVDCGGPCSTQCAEIKYEVTWIPSNITPVHIQGIPDNKIDVVFIASKTSWDWKNSQKVFSSDYIGYRDKFILDVKNMVQKWFLKLDTLVSAPIPSDFKERFNFYYYWDTHNFGDSFEGCSGKPPNGFWNFAPFADVAGILYTPYFVDGYAEAGGCANSFGPRSHFKGPGFNGYVTIHEAGHAIFALVDEYCGDTSYLQNDPYPNVWISEDNCRDDVSSESWDPDNCRQITWDNTSTPGIDCTRDYWRWNPDPEIMNCGYGLFGPACVRHINYMFEKVDAWRQ